MRVVNGRTSRTCLRKVMPSMSGIMKSARTTCACSAAMHSSAARGSVNVCTSYDVSNSRNERNAAATIGSSSTTTMRPVSDPGIRILSHQGANSARETLQQAERELWCVFQQIKKVRAIDTQQLTGFG